MNPSREARLGQTFVTLADTLVSGFDLDELLYNLASTCVTLLPVDAAGILLASPAGALQVVGSSDERLRLLELFELQNEAGPCLDCYRSGEAVSEPDLAASSRWPQFAERAVREDFRAVDALPMRLRDHVIGALNLFRHDPGGVPRDDLDVAQALADVATIGLIQERLLREQRLVAEQLQAALQSRVVIEQAKGIVAEQGSTTVDQAFARIRHHARVRNVTISDLARRIIAGEVTARTLDRRDS